MDLWEDNLTTLLIVNEQDRTFWLVFAWYILHFLNTGGAAFLCHHISRFCFFAATLLPLLTNTLVLPLSSFHFVGNLLPNSALYDPILFYTRFVPLLALKGLSPWLLNKNNSSFARTSGGEAKPSSLVMRIQPGDSSPSWGSVQSIGAREQPRLVWSPGHTGVRTKRVDRGHRCQPHLQYHCIEGCPTWP